MDTLDLKLYAINSTAFLVSYSDYLEPMLKILLLAATLGYTLHKWYKLYKKKNEADK
tara:strand:+ start:401 stop:571 length:171 start_codon:yes stop_codon:yes gene_type:complete